MSEVDDNCAICMEPVAPYGDFGPNRGKRCLNGHLCHHKCMREWTRSRHAGIVGGCPICRGNVSPYSESSVSDSDVGLWNQPILESSTETDLSSSVHSSGSSYRGSGDGNAVVGNLRTHVMELRNGDVQTVFDSDMDPDEEDRYMREVNAARYAGRNDIVDVIDDEELVRQVGRRIGMASAASSDVIPRRFHRSYNRIDLSNGGDFVANIFPRRIHRPINRVVNTLPGVGSSHDLVRSLGNRIPVVDLTVSSGSSGRRGSMRTRSVADNLMSSDSDFGGRIVRRRIVNSGSESSGRLLRDYLPRYSSSSDPEESKIETHFRMHK